MQLDDLKWWQALVGMVGSSFVAVFCAGIYFRGFIARIELLEIRQNKTDKILDKLNNEISKRLYNEDGSLIYMSSSLCDKMQASCQKHLTERLDDIKSDTEYLKGRIK